MKKLENILMEIDIAQMFYSSQRNSAVKTVREIQENGNKADLGQLMSLSVFAGVSAKAGRDLKAKIMDALRAYNNISFFSLAKYQYWGLDKRVKLVIKELDYEISEMEKIEKAADEGSKKAISNGINSHFDKLFGKYLNSSCFVLSKIGRAHV